MAASLERISSAANPLLKEIRRAVRHGGLTHGGCLVADSFHLLEEALRSGCGCETVLVSENARPRAEAIARAAGRDVAIRIVEDSLLSKASATETPQGIVALIRPPAWTLSDLFGVGPLVVVLDGVQDPGNAGAIVRAAEAFGATGALFLRDTAGPYNPKTIRASAGSLFRLPFIHGLERQAIRRELQARGLQVLAAGAQTGQPPQHVDWTLPSALVIGSEAHGVSAALGRDATAVRIPTQGVESLNASAAAAVLLYEASRQRAGSDGDNPDSAARDAAGKALA